MITDLPQFMVYICIVIWAVGTALTFGLQIFRPRPLTGSFKPWSNMRHAVMLMTVVSWLAAMFIFRPMY